MQILFPALDEFAQHDRGPFAEEKRPEIRGTFQPLRFALFDREAESLESSGRFIQGAADLRLNRYPIELPPQADALAGGIGSTQRYRHGERILRVVASQD